MEAETKICLLPAVLFPASGQQALLCGPQVGATLVPAALVPALRGCAVFRTVDEHCGHAARTRQLAPGAEELFRQNLLQLRGRGFFVAEALLRASHDDNPATGDTGQLTIECLGLVTRDRPDRAAASLRSYLTNSTRAGRRNQVIFCDDSRDPALSRANLQVAQQIQEERGVPVRYLAMREKETYAARLSQAAGLPPETVRAALLDSLGTGFTRGANTNALMLDTLGDAAFCFDDDSICRPARMGDGDDPGIDLSSSQRPARMVVYPGFEALLDEAREQPACLLEEHERWLGRALGQVLATAETINLEEAGPSLLVSAVRKRARVSLTWSGIYGDSGSEHPTYYLSMPPADRAKLVQSEEMYRAALERRIIWKAPPRVRIARSPFFQSVAFGIDNRGFLPPFLPFLRASDVVFGQLLGICSKDSFVAYLPWSVLHHPEPARQQSADLVWRKAGALRLAELVGICQQTVPGLAALEAAEDRLRAMGRHLRHLAQLEPQELEAFLYPTLMEKWTDDLVAMERLLRLHDDQPSFWADDVRRTMQVLEDRLLADHPLRIELSLPDANVSPRVLLRTFGEVAEAWPDMRSAGFELRQREIRPSRPLNGPRRIV
jgi:hypothetical protein